MFVQVVDGAVVVCNQRIVDGVGGEDVRWCLQTALMAFVVVFCSRERTTHVGADGEVFERLVYVSHQVAI